jgi:hypothetical protein
MIADLIQQAASAPALAGVGVKSIRIATTYRLDAILTITWSWPEFGEVSQPSGLPGVAMSVAARPADLTLALVLPGPTVHEAEHAVLDVAWQLGAWDVRRMERAPLADPKQWREARHGLASDFGVNLVTIAGVPVQKGDRAPYADLRAAAVDGWVTWSFVPLAFATRTMRARWGGKDKTLEADCTRSGALPPTHFADWHHPEPGYAHEHIYQLGRANHGNRSKAARERRA